MKKRITALLLCCVMLLTLCPGLISTATAYDDTQPDQAEATGETVQPTVNFTNVAPFLPPVSGGVRMLRAPLAAPRAAANFAANDAATDNGMKISKTATRNDDGSYTITLEAYATGSKVITEQKTDIPTDIILVLDQSGSMDFCIVCGEEMYGYNDYHYTYVATTSINTNNTYYIKNGNDYTDVQYCSGTHYGFLSSWPCDGGVGWYTSTSDDHTTANKITPKTSDNPEGTQFYEYKMEACSSRLQALKIAATNFANQVALKAKGKDGNVGTGDDVEHRIAVVGYAGISSNLTNGFKQMNNTSQAADVSSAIDNLTANGGTHIDQGLSTANGIFDNNPIGDTENRNRVVIVFTDGAPGLYGDWDSESVETANNAIAYAKTAKEPTSEGGYGATVYTIGIFSGADASNPDSLPAYTSYTTEWGFEQSPSEADQVKNSNRFMHLVSSNYPDASSITEPGSINPNLNGKSYYLSAADSVALNNIFQQISDQIESGGSSSTLTEESVIKDIISPQFTLPAGATTDSITLETYKYKGPSFDAANAWEKNPNAMGATATIDGDQVSVTGFDFAANYVGTVTENGNVSYRGNKLVISFKVQPKAGFLGGNDVYTNTSAGVYENGSATDPVLSFPQPQVNVPIDDVTVTANDKNVYLKGEVTAAQLKEGATVTVGEGTKAVSLDLSKANENYGLEAWQTEYVNITVTVKDKDGNAISDKLENLTEDTTYTVAVTVAPKTTGTTSEAKGEAATAKSGENNPAANVNVFTPEVNFKDSTIYRGNTADYSINQTDTPVWKHGNTVATAVDMIGTAPTLTYSYDKGEDAFEDCTNVNVTVKIGSTDVTDKTTGDKLFTVHVLQPVITATVNDVERYYGESYTLGDGANGAIDLTWTDNHNHSAIPPVTGDMPYDANDLSLAYSTTAFSGKTGTVPASDFDVTVKVMKDDTVMPATITTKCDYGCSADQTDEYTVHVKTCTLTIIKSGCNITMDANQSFIFDVTGGAIAQEMQVTVQGDGSAKIVGLPVGIYTVTEDGDWSWRYTAKGDGNVTLDAANHTGTVIITNERTDPYWLSGDSYAVNYKGCSNAQGTFLGA